MLPKEAFAKLAASFTSLLIAICIAILTCFCCIKMLANTVSMDYMLVNIYTVIWALPGITAKGYSYGYTPD